MSERLLLLRVMFMNLETNVHIIELHKQYLDIFNVDKINLKGYC